MWTAVQAAILKLSGQLERAEAALRKLREMPGFKPHQLFLFHLLTGETDRSADCMKQVEERYFLAAVLLRLAQGVYPSPALGRGREDDESAGIGVADLC
jgi:hypothetical protein